MQCYLPCWKAALASQLLVRLIPVVGVLYPLFRLLPLAYGGVMRMRIFRLYGEITFLEAEIEARPGPAAAADLAARLDELKQRAHHLYVPQMYSDLLYTLRPHIGTVRTRLATPGRQDT